MAILSSSTRNRDLSLHEMLRVQSMARLLLLLLVLPFLLLSRLSAAASTSDISALLEFASKINLPSAYWNPGTNPCSGRWIGICCSVSPENCCPTAKFNPGESSCTGSHDENATIVVVSLDTTYYPSQVNGFIADSICNLTSLLQLDLSNNNNLTGQIPPCIGDKLTQLRGLRLGGGNLTGRIPSQLGKLTKLERLSLDNNELFGDIPSSFRELHSLQELNLRGNELSGQIPPWLGELRSLQNLQLQVNLLNGSIPGSLVNLNNLTTLMLFRNQLSGVLNLTVFQAMPGLTSLDLHGNSFTGPVPAFGQEFAKLGLLSLEFNQFSGTIPASLGALPAITELYLGHNNLSGSIPHSFASLNSSLDISHNSLSGPLPVSPQSSLDFSFNAFDSRPGQHVTYFSCIHPMNSTACVRSTPGKFSSFAVTSGVQVTNKDGTIFEADPGLSRTGFSYLGRAGNWAFEASGTSVSTYTPPGLRKIQRVPDEENPALYETMRWSSTYMAYHGGGLENGEYNVTMYFAETLFQYIDFRVFDVLLQGIVVEKDLDVVQRSGFSTAFKIHRKVSVTEGSLSIEFLNTGKDRYLDKAKYGVTSSGPMVSSILVRTLNPGQHAGPKNAWRKPTLAAVLSLAAVAVLIRIAWYIKCSRNHLEDGTRGGSTSIRGLKTYTFKELHQATHGFGQHKKLGQGAFGIVYLGNIKGKQVAVKQLLAKTPQSKEAFRKEMEILSSVQHRNLLSVKGCCVDAEFPMLVCDYMPNGSLDQLLYTGQLTWEERKSIAIGTALGLAYLHDESKDKIIHCDVKPPNILLDQELSPRIGDFGMARLYEEGKSHITATKMGGTVGYLAPEYAMHYQLSEKADVYSFGVVLLELISGRRVLELQAKAAEEVSLVEWAQNLASTGVSHLLMDSRLQGENPPPLKEVVDAAAIALHCIQESASDRPPMRTVWLMLRGVVDIPPVQHPVLKMDTTVKTLISCYEMVQQLSLGSDGATLTYQSVQQWSDHWSIESRLQE